MLSWCSTSRRKRPGGDDRCPQGSVVTSPSGLFATYLAQVAEIEVSMDGTVRVRRVVCAVDCGTAVNPDTVRAQIQSAIIFGVTATFHGETILKAVDSAVCWHRLGLS
jgi:CO/xanthine dehydrogenase Mo-binding subunit